MGPWEARPKKYHPSRICSKPHQPEEKKLPVCSIFYSLGCPHLGNRRRAEPRICGNALCAVVQTPEPLHQKLKNLGHFSSTTPTTNWAQHGKCEGVCVGAHRGPGGGAALERPSNIRSQEATAASYFPFKRGVGVGMG